MSSPKKETNCYIYTRIATQLQADGYSLDAQRELLLREAERRGMAVAAEFSDVGSSGKDTAGRPQLMKMLDRIRNGNPDGVSCVLVTKLSRFGRNTADVLNDLQIMQDHGVSLLSVDDGIDTASAEGKLVIATSATLSAVERGNIPA